MDDVHTSLLFDRKAIKPGEYAPDNVASDYKSSKLGSQIARPAIFDAQRRVGNPKSSTISR